jgi:hypothetical protein
MVLSTKQNMLSGPSTFHTPLESWEHLCRRMPGRETVLFKAIDSRADTEATTTLWGAPPLLESSLQPSP